MNYYIRLQQFPNLISPHPVNKTFSSELPHSLEAERTVLGCLLADTSAMVRIRSRLHAEDFYDPIHRAIYNACESVFDARDPVDFITVAHALEDNQQIRAIGGSGFLAGLAAEIPTTSHLEKYVSIVREKSGHRSLISVGKKISALGSDLETSFTAGISTAQSELLKLGENQLQQSKVSLGDVAERQYEAATEAQAGGDAYEQGRFFTGFSNLDYFFDGFEPDSFTVLAGRPSMGKTALMLNMGMNAAVNEKKHVLFLSLEMSNRQLADRILSGRLKVPMSDIRRGKLTDEQLQQMGNIAGELQQLSFFIEDQVNTTVAEIMAKAMQHQLEYGLDVLLIDYLQLIGKSNDSSRNSSRVDQFSEISRELKALARTLQVPVVVGSQLSRAGETRIDKRPQMSDIRESGAIEQDADNILILYRDDYYYEDSDTPGITTVYVRKNRQGAVGAADLMFQKDTTTFLPVDRRAGE